MAEIQPVTTGFQRGVHTAESGKQVADPHLSVAASARALRISPTTLRRYIKDYEDHVDVVRDGRKLMVAVSSIPALAHIRDLRARNYSRDDIQQILAAPPGQFGHAGPGEWAGTAVEEAVNTALGDLRAEMASIKRASLDSEVVIRQSLANILFLIEKFGKELQFHVSEERMANNERDLRLTHLDPKLEQPPEARDGEKSLLSAIATFYRRLVAAAFSR